MVIEKESCNVVIKNVCRDEIIIKPVEKLNRVCKVPEKICTNNTVKRLRLVLKQICGKLKKIFKNEK